MATNNDTPNGLTRIKNEKNVFEKKAREETAFFENATEYLNTSIKILSKDKSLKEETSKLESETIKAGKLYQEERDKITVLIKDMIRSNATEEEKSAFIKKQTGELTKNTTEFQNKITKIGNSIKDSSKKSNVISMKDSRVLQEQLSLAEKNNQFQKINEIKQKQITSNERQKYSDEYDAWDDDLWSRDRPKTAEEIKEILEKSLETAVKENQERRREAELQRRIEKDHWQEDKDLENFREKEDKKRDKKRGLQDKIADKKGSLLAGVLSPFKALTDPLFELFTEDSLNTEEFFQSKFKKKRNTSRELEDEQIKRKREQEDEALRFERDLESKKNDLIVDAQKQLEKLAGGEVSLLPHFEKQFAAQEQKQNREIDLTPSLEEAAYRKIPDLSVENIFEPTRTEAMERKILSPSIESILTPSPIASFIGEDKDAQEQLISDLTDAEYNPLLEKTAPNQNALLAKGGILGASAVYLGNLLGDQLNEMTEGQDKKRGDGGLLDNVKGFLSKNGLALMKLAAPLAVMAVGGVLIKKGLDMQQRDTEDSKKYFDEGNTGRGIETAWLGDRAKLTEENATSELGRTTGKTALLAGGAATVGVGAAGAVAAGGALAGGAGLAGSGAAGLAAMGAAFPPALIAAAVAVGVTVIAKGTQEAFELGWDKNQASIQKELNSVIFDEDASVWERVKASAESTWKGFTGSLAGGIREAGSILDAETMIQNEKQIKFLQEQAEAGNEDYARLLDVMQSEQFNAMSKSEQKMLMQSEGLYDDYEKMQQETQKSFGEHLLTAGKTVGGLFTGLIDTTMEGARGKETARWESEALKGMENMSGEDVARLKQSQEYQDTMANGGNAKSAMEAAYLKEQKDTAIARGDLTKDGMVIQKGGGVKGALAGYAAGGISGAIMGGVAGDRFGKYFGFGDTGLAYKKQKTGTDDLDNEYRQTFEYSKRKAELMNEGKNTEEADLAVIAEQNQLYQDSLTLRLKQSDDYKKAFDEELEISKDIKKAETAGLEAAKKNEKNMMSTTQLMKAKFTEVWDSVRDFAGNVGGWFKDRFSAAGQGMADLGKAIADGASAVWNSITEWASGLWEKIGEKFTRVLDGLKDFGGGVLDAGKAGLDWLGDKASGVWDRLAGEGRQADASINDGIVLKNGKVIEISSDDNVYATKNEPRIIRDQEAQAAMPSIQKTPAEFTDKNIVAMLQTILERLNKMNIQPQVVTSGGDVNFEGLKMAGNL
jgi:hypothetical protein